MKNNYFLPLIIVLSIASCSKDNSESVIEPAIPKSTYSLGWEDTNAESNSIVLWKDTIKKVLLTSDKSTRPIDIAFENGKQYVLYITRNQANLSTTFHLITDGISKKLIFNENTGDIIINSLIINNGDVYMTGRLRNPVSGVFKPCYWKNGKLNLLEGSGNLRGEAFDLALIGNDVYVVGSFEVEINSNNRKIALWKNGVKNELTNGENPVSDPILATNGIDVYVAAGEYNGIIAPGLVGLQGFYVKNNDARVNLNQGVNGSLPLFILEPKDIKIAGSDLYILAIESQNASQNATGGRFHFVYKNGAKMPFVFKRAGDPDDDMEVESIEIIGPDVYGVGASFYSKDDFNDSATRWKNGEPTRLGSKGIFSYALKMISY